MKRPAGPGSPPGPAGRSLPGHNGAMPAEYLVVNPCQDACGDRETAEKHNGETVHMCPGCDTTWIEIPRERPARETDR